MLHRLLIAFAIVAIPALTQSPAAIDAPITHVRHIIGLENVPFQESGKLSVTAGALLFEAGKSQAKVPISSIADIFIGQETTQSNTKGGRTLEYVALGLPYYSGRVFSVFTRTHVDILTVLYRDANHGLHSAILALPKDSAAQVRTRLIAAGAHHTEPQSLAVPQAYEESANSLKQMPAAIEIEPVEAGNISIPAEFRYAIYERLIEKMRLDGKFQKVFRSGDREADGIADLAVLRATVSRFKEGGETKRELTMVAGGTVVDVNATITRRDGAVVLDKTVQGHVLYFGENLGVANDVAKRIAKLLQETPAP